jgi:hypothetical protein
MGPGSPGWDLGASQRGAQQGGSTRRRKGAKLTLVVAGHGFPPLGPLRQNFEMTYPGQSLVALSCCCQFTKLTYTSIAYQIITFLMLTKHCLPNVHHIYAY